MRVTTCGFIVAILLISLDSFGGDGQKELPAYQDPRCVLRKGGCPTTTPPDPEQGKPCLGQYDCRSDQFCRKANSTDLRGVCVNNGL